MYRSAALCLLIILFTPGCSEYSRGDRFNADLPGDSLLYVVAAKGPGTKLSEIASRMKLQHEIRGNTCEIRYLTDSVLLNDRKGLLLINTTVPNLEEDLLSKGFIGTFASKQIVSYLVVGYDDIGKYFIKVE